MMFNIKWTILCTTLQFFIFSCTYESDQKSDTSAISKQDKNPINISNQGEKEILIGEEQRICILFNNFENARNVEEVDYSKVDSLYYLAIDSLYNYLSNQKNTNYPFSCLDNQISIISSSDNHLRSYNSLIPNGGSYHQYLQSYQYVSNGTVHIDQFKEGDFSDYNIYNLNESKHQYLVLSCAQFCTTCLQNVASIVEIKDSLVFTKILKISYRSAPNEDFGIWYDQKTKTISYKYIPEEEYEGDLEEYENKSKDVIEGKMKFNGEKFIEIK